MIWSHPGSRRSHTWRAGAGAYAYRVAATGAATCGAPAQAALHALDLRHGRAVHDVGRTTVR
jgi:hypothetical protein